MKMDLESFCVFLGFFLISMSVYAVVWMQCNSDSSKDRNNEDLLYIFESQWSKKLYLIVVIMIIITLLNFQHSDKSLMAYLFLSCFRIRSLFSCGEISREISILNFIRLPKTELQVSQSKKSSESSLIDIRLFLNLFLNSSEVILIFKRRLWNRFNFP